MDAGTLPLFNHLIPPPIAISYWKLGACACASLPSSMLVEGAGFS